MDIAEKDGLVSNSSREVSRRSTAPLGESQLERPSPVIKTEYLIWSRLKIVAGCIAAFLLGLVVLKASPKVALLAGFFPPAVLILVAILRAPFLGVFIYYFLEYLRPQDLIRPLAPLRLPMLTSIVALSSWIFYFISQKKQIIWHRQSWVFLCFLGVISITVFTATNNRWAYDTFIGMSVTFLAYFLATNTVDSLAKFRRFIWLLLFIHAFLAFRGIQHYLTSGYTARRATGGFISDENDFAMLLTIIIPFAYFMIVKLKDKKLMGVTLLTIFLMGIVFSFSRGGFVGLAAVFTYCLAKTKQKLKILGVVFFLAVVLISVAPSQYWAEMSSISDVEGGTARTRRDYWKAGFEMFKDYPIVGVGAANSGIRMPEYYMGTRDPNTQWGRVLHSTISEVTAELGLLGTICFILFFVFNFKSLKKIDVLHYRSEEDRQFITYFSHSIRGGMIGYIVSALFLSTLYYPHLYTLTAMTVILTDNALCLPREE